MDRNIKNPFLFISFSVIGLLLFSYACNDPEPEVLFSNSDLVENDTVESDIFDDQVNDAQMEEVFVVDKKSVVFFVINNREVKELIHDLGDTYRWDSEAMFTNFKNQFNTFQNILRKQNIQCVLSHNKQFEIRQKDGKIHKFNRIESGQIMGQIISDGVQAPKIQYGIWGNQELVKIIEEYFSMQSIGYVPPDSLEVVKDEKSGL
jgi:hypothetical protein